MSKLGSKDNPHLFLDWCGNIGNQNIAHLNLKVVQGRKSQGQAPVSRDTTLA